LKTLAGIGLANVQAVYSGFEGHLWQLIMGEQIHIGGFKSSMSLAQKAGIKPGSKGVDLCCCIGAGMRFLVRFCGVGQMTGVDATPQIIERGINIIAEEGLSDKIAFKLGDACDTHLEGGNVDFVWGEDAWCYVEDNPGLIKESARLVKKGGTIAFTDWVEGPNPMTQEESDRFLAFMKFPNFPNIAEYRNLLEQNGCKIRVAEDTGLYAPCIDLYLQMLDMQLTFDALKIIGWDPAVMEGLAKEMVFIQGLAHSKKVVQGMFIAEKA
jgi:SAM-dependent methyltransferase